MASETGILNMAMNDTTDDIVALQDKSTTATIGTVLQIDAEFMTVTDASDQNNLKVTRNSGGTVGSHSVGAQVSIGVTLPEPPPVVEPPKFTYTMEWTDPSGVLYPTSYWVVAGTLWIDLNVDTLNFQIFGYRDQAAYDAAPRLEPIGQQTASVSASSGLPVLDANKAKINEIFLTALHGMAMFKNLKPA